jgi:L-threonylcarbamoyladenylate synthase
MKILKNNTAGILEACEYLRSGKLVIWPSHVWYGISASALHQQAVSRIYQAKQRNAQEALLLLTTGRLDAERYGHLNDAAQSLIETFWPGFLGIIVKKKDLVPDFVTAGKETVLLASLEELGAELPLRAGIPLVASSANISGTLPAIDMDEVMEFTRRAGDKIDAVIEGGISPFNRPTTLVDTTTTPPRIIRTGVVHERAIRKVLPDIIVDERTR